MKIRFSRLVRLFLGMIALCWLAAACAPAPQYQVSRAALVSPPAPPMWSGKAQSTGFGMGNSTVVWKNPPDRAAESDSGLYVAGTQMDGTFHLGLGKHVSLWFPLSYGLSYGSFAAAPCLQDRPGSGVFTGGFGVGASGHVSDMWYLGGSLEAMVAFVPGRIRAVCVDNCTYADQVVEKEEIDSVGVIRASFLAGLDLDWIRIFGGLTFRNHPTNVQLTREVTYVPEALDNEMSFGPMYVMIGLGAEVDIGDHVSLLAQIYQPFPMAQQDLLYGPVLGLALDVHFPATL